MRGAPKPLEPTRWTTLMDRLGLGRNLETFHDLRAAYAAKHRHYHTSEHINQCLAELDRVREQALRPDEIELALWFHDAVYVTRRKDNEARSARWAVQFLTSNAVDAERSQRVSDLIMATTHDAAVQDADAMILVDVDLSILGADPATYACFEANVREEYWWVPGVLFGPTRARILQSFLDRPSVYMTAPFRERLEHAARRNLAAAIAELTKQR
jgi:predicted metal-dependent HD superfamily phosphohydrolase